MSQLPIAINKVYPRQNSKGKQPIQINLRIIINQTSQPNNQNNTNTPNFLVHQPSPACAQSLQHNMSTIQNQHKVSPFYILQPQSPLMPPVYNKPIFINNRSPTMQQNRHFHFLNAQIVLYQEAINDRRSQSQSSNLVNEVNFIKKKYNFRQQSKFNTQDQKKQLNVIKNQYNVQNKSQITAQSKLNFLKTNKFIILNSQSPQQISRYTYRDRESTEQKIHKIQQSQIIQNEYLKKKFKQGNNNTNLIENKFYNKNQKQYLIEKMQLFCPLCKKNISYREEEKHLKSHRNILKNKISFYEIQKWDYQSMNIQNQKKFKQQLIKKFVIISQRFNQKKEKSKSILNPSDELKTTSNIYQSIQTEKNNQLIQRQSSTFLNEKSKTPQLIKPNRQKVSPIIKIQFEQQNQFSRQKANQEEQNKYTSSKQDKDANIVITSFIGDDNKRKRLPSNKLAYI